jgi:hypothetical protein
MKKIVLGVLACALIAGPAFAGSHLTSGYYRKSGTYVAPHYQTNSDHSRFNNWFTRGNSNPYTGKAGTRSPYRTHY